MSLQEGALLSLPFRHKAQRPFAGASSLPAPAEAAAAPPALREVGA